jgi:hypothetical protein
MKRGEASSVSDRPHRRDHTQGTRAGAPTPRAHVADNDLALGRLVEAVSHSILGVNGHLRDRGRRSERP